MAAAADQANTSAWRDLRSSPALMRDQTSARCFSQNSSARSEAMHDHSGKASISSRSDCWSLASAGPLALHWLNGELSPLPLLHLAQLSCRACELRFYRTHFDVEDICNLGQRHLFSESQQEYRTLLGGQR